MQANSLDGGTSCPYGKTTTLGQFDIDDVEAFTGDATCSELNLNYEVLSFAIELAVNIADGQLFRKPSHRRAETWPPSPVAVGFAVDQQEPVGPAEAREHRPRAR